MKRKEKQNKIFFRKKYIFLVLLFFAFFVTLNFFVNKNAHAADPNCIYTEFGSTCDDGSGGTVVTTPTGGTTAVNSSGKVTSSSDSNIFIGALNLLLYAVFQFFGLIVSFAGIVFNWAINPNNFTRVMSMDSIYNFWMIVRDFLNLFFILVLLFSAFCTVFGVTKYHIKNIILMVVIMALLVNFSFPIARFIIDIGNILMYFIINKAFPGLSNSSGISEAFAQFSVQKFLDPGYADHSGTELTLRLIASNFFLFIFGMTLLIIAMLLLIRIIVLAVLVIFSPIAFTAEILPNFSSFASKWWTLLFEQTFFGPIMAFMLYLALSMMQEVQSKQLFPVSPVAPTDNFSNLLTGALQLAIPIVILWLGIMAAQSMKAVGANAAVKYARMGMNKATLLPWKGMKLASKASGVTGGVKQASDYYRKKGAPGFLKKIPGLRGTDKTEESESWIANKLTGGKAGLSPEGLGRKRIAEKVSEFEKIDLSETDAKKKLATGTAEERKAVAMYLSKKEKIKDYATYEAAMGALDPTKDKELRERITGQVKKDNNVHLIIQHKVDVEGKTEMDAVNETLKEMGPADIAKQKGLHEIVNSTDPKLNGIKNELDAYFSNLKTSADPNKKIRYRKIVQGLDEKSYDKWKSANLV